MTKFLSCFTATALLLSIFVLSRPTVARASTLTVHVGPPSFGGGGSNPISIPPTNPVEYEVVYLTNSASEWCFGLTPGILLFGKRTTFASGAYFSAGGGLLNSANGQGLGPYAAFGVDIGTGVAFNAEYKQTLGLNLSGGGIVSPYAIRIGVSFKM